MGSTARRSPEDAQIPSENGPTRPQVAPVRPSEPRVRVLVDALTAELADAGYTEEESFGYSAERLEQAGVHLVGATVAGDLVGIGGVELEGDGFAELKRFYVVPTARGTGVADAVLTALLAYAAERGARTLRLETGVRQHAALAFYARHGFTSTARFGPYVDCATSVCLQRDLTADLRASFGEETFL